MNSKSRMLEKKLYELLGVNIFRKYILFTWEKITKLLKIDVGYRLDDYSIESIKNYKGRAKGFAIAHIICFLVCLPFATDLVPFLYNLLLNSYCVMVQRYNYIRIEELEKKYKKMQVLKERRQKRLEEMKREKAKNLSLDKINELTTLFSNHVSIATNNLSSFKVVEARPYVANVSNNEALTPEFWLNANLPKKRILERKVS